MKAAREALQSNPEAGTSFWAHEQSQGRGRKPGRTWESPPASSLLVSILLPETDIPAQPVASLTLGLAVAYTIEEIFKKSKPVPRLNIKWPNDILIEGKKTAGIICETGRSPAGTRYCIAGIGINAFSKPPAEATRIPASCLQDVCAPPPLEELLSALLRQIQLVINLDGPTIVQEITKRLEHLGQPMIWHPDIESRAQPIRGTLTGISPLGEAILQNLSGNQTISCGELRPDEKNLIY